MPEQGPSLSRRRQASTFLTLSLAAALLWAPGLSRKAAAQDGSPPLEYQVKAAFLFNFAKFIEWPPDAIGGPEEAFVVCVVDNDAFARALDLAVSGKTVNGHSLKVRRLRAGDDSAFCRMLYLGSTDTPRLANLFKRARTAAVLTVGDTPGFSRQGGIINFIVQDNRVHFEINPDAAFRAGLRISSKLLQLATIVRDGAGVENEQ